MYSRDSLKSELCLISSLNRTLSPVSRPALLCSLWTLCLSQNKFNSHCSYCSLSQREGTREKEKLAILTRTTITCHIHFYNEENIHLEPHHIWPLVFENKIINKFSKLGKHPYFFILLLKTFLSGRAYLSLGKGRLLLMGLPGLGMELVNATSQYLDMRCPFWWFCIFCFY